MTVSTQKYRAWRLDSSVTLATLVNRVAQNRVEGISITGPLAIWPNEPRVDVVEPRHIRPICDYISQFMDAVRAMLRAPKVEDSVRWCSQHKRMENFKDQVLFSQFVDDLPACLSSGPEPEPVCVDNDLAFLLVVLDATWGIYLSTFTRILSTRHVASDPGPALRG